MMNIWTFWEPRDKMPAYLQLCMKTWEKFLPNAKINLLDYSNIENFIDVNEYDESLFSGQYRIDQIADALRALLLEKHGGIWLDVDTIILNRAAQKYFTADGMGGGQEALFFGRPKERGVHLAFIKVKPHSRIMKYWIECVKDRLEDGAPPPSKRFFRYLGNGIINPYVKATTDKFVKVLDRRPLMPELDLISNSSGTLELTDHKKAYQDFYFMQHHRLPSFRADMLMLHNSWAPGILKLMTYDELMHFDCTMTNVLFEVLGIDRSHIREFLVFTND